MKESERIQDDFSRIIEIVNQMRSYGDKIPDQRVVEKMGIRLPEKYESIVTAIEEAKDISSLTVHEWMGSLQSHEQRLNRHAEKSVESAFQSLGSRSFLEKESTSFDRKKGDTYRG